VQQPIAPDLIKWYRALGAHAAGYGQTENTGLATACPTRIKLGTLGVRRRTTELQISEKARSCSGPACLHGYLKSAGQDRRDAARRLAAHRRRRLRRQRRLREDHRPHEDIIITAAQEHHAVGDREPAEVLAYISTPS